MDSGDATTTIANVLGPPSAIVGATYRIDVVGSSAPLDIGKSVTVDPQHAGRILLGKSSVCDVVLADPSVSRRHAAVEVDGALLKLVDLGSTNRTFVNDVIVTEATLRGGETIRIGDTFLTVRVVDQRSVELSPDLRFGRLLGGSPAMRRLYPLCAKLAASNVPVVVEGETGTGKELLAEALHENGPRATRPFMVFDCTAVAPSLVESALFGHERGAFTNAVTTRRGAFESADGGTLLIDEIGDLDPALQPKLLRVLERGQVQRVGGTSWIKCDVRIIAATRRDLEREVQKGRFREDLFYRLAVARIELPPLRARAGDVGLLARHFWRTLGGEGAMPAELAARFEDYAWPGNVRELRNAVSRYVALGELADDPRATPRPSQPPPSLVADPIAEVLALKLPLPLARKRVVDAFEQRYVEHVLAQHDGNVTRAAEASGIARRHFYTIRGRGSK